MEYVLSLPGWLEIAAIVTGSISGAMTAVRAKYDIFGTLSLAFITGFFGGVIRDVLLQNQGFYLMENPDMLLVCAISAMAVFFFGRLISYLDPLVEFLDNVSGALWAIIGAGKGLLAGVDPIPAALLGTITACGGGISRDVLMRRVPLAFQAGTLNGSAALIGSSAFCILFNFHLLPYASAVLCAGLTIALRYLSLFFGLTTKESRDYSDVVTNILIRPARKASRLVKDVPNCKVKRDKRRLHPTKRRLFLVRLAYGKHEASQRGDRSSDCVSISSRSEIAKVVDLAK